MVPSLGKCGFFTPIGRRPEPRRMEGGGGGGVEEVAGSRTERMFAEYKA